MAKPLDRRTFLKVAAYGVGGALLSTGLTGCGLGAPPFDQGYPDLPSGYRFYRLNALGDLVGGPGRELILDQFFGTAHLSGGTLAEDVLTFSARDTADRAAIVQLGLDLDRSQPLVTWQRTMVRSGDVLSDGREVRRFGAMDVNEAGSVAAVVHAAPTNIERHYGAGLYLAHGGADFEPLLISGDTFDGGDRVAVGIIGDVDLHEGNDVLVAAAHAPDRAGTLPPGHTLLHLPAASLAGARPVMTTGDVLRGTDHMVTDFGLLDLHDEGNFTVQTRTAALVEPTRGELLTGAPIENVASVVSGSLAAPADHDLIAGPPGVAPDAYDGETHYGPRMLPDGRTLVVVHVGGGQERLLLGDQPLISSGDASPAGGTVLGFGPGSISPNGVIFYQLYSNVTARQALVATNGVEHRVVLARGDEVMNWGSPVDEILFGTTTHHANGKERLALLCSFADTTQALVVGVPV